MTAPAHVRRRGELRFVRLRALGYESYSDYLRSAHWLATRARFRASDQPQVCICGADDDLQLHHKTYERIGGEELEDLVLLCERCHALIHELERRGEIDLDFEGFASAERALRYAAERRPPEPSDPPPPTSLAERVAAIEDAQARGLNLGRQMARLRQAIEVAEKVLERRTT